MRVVCFLLFGVISVFAQPLSVGLKGGVPLSDFTETVSKPLETFRTSRRLIVGPSLELRLPAGLGVEFDYSYRLLELPRAFGAAIVVVVLSVAIISIAGKGERAVHARWT